MADVDGDRDCGVRAREYLTALRDHLGQRRTHVGPAHVGQRRRQAAYEVERLRSGEHPEGGRHAGQRREHEPADAEAPGHPPGVDRAGAARGDERAAPDVAPALDRVHPRGARHVLVDDAVDAGGRLLQ
jgi:hypothetical protein